MEHAPELAPEHAPELAPELAYMEHVLAKRDPRSSLVARVARAVPFVVVSSGSLATFVVFPPPSRTRTV